MVILVTEQWGGLGLALLMQRQGSEVVCAYDYTHVGQDEVAATRRCGEGLVQKIRLAEALRRFPGQGALWVFDANDFPTEADALRRQGEWVIGTSVLGRKLEDDRDFAVQLARAVGFAVPLTEEFHDTASAVRYLHAHPDQAFAYKPDKQDPTATYVPQEQEDPAKANAELEQYLHHLKGAASFVLQEVLHGTEVTFDLWVRDGQPVAAFCDLESKRKLVGDLGVNIGCAGNYVLALPIDSPGIQQTVAHYLTYEPLAHYTGSVDANVMVVEGVPYFLENGFRFGYNAYPVMFQALATGAAEEILRAWIGGSDELSGAFQDLVGGSLTLVVDFPVRGTPLILSPAVAKATYLYRAYAEDGQLALVEGWSEVAAVVSVAASIPEAGQQCLALAGQIGIPDQGYRIDLASADRPTLPLARYLTLQAGGWFGPSEGTDLKQLVSRLLAGGV